MRKLLWFTVGVVIAASVGMYWLEGFWYFLASGVAALFLCVFLLLMKRIPKVRTAAMVLLGCMIGFVWMFVVDSQYFIISRAADEKRVILTLTATDYSRETEYGTVTEGVGQLNGKIYKLNVYLPKEANIQPGDKMTGRFLLRSTLPGCMGESQYSCSHGIFLTAKMTRMPTIEKAEQLPWYGYPAALRQNIKAVLNSIFPQDAAGFAIALLIGDTDGIDYETDVALKVSGIRHVIAVSGLHVTILFTLFHMLLGKNRWLSALIGIPVLFAFAAVVGFSASITRACLMHSLMIIATLFDKDYDPLTALAFAVLFMLTANSWTICDVGFQLSVSCMLGIILFSEPIKQRIMDCKLFNRKKGKSKRLISGVASSISMSIGASILVTPLCAYYFGMVSLVGVLTNLLTLWVITFIFYGIMMACLLGFLWVPVGGAIAWVISWPIRYVLAVSKTLASMPLAAVYTGSIYVVFWLIFVYILLFVNFFSRKKKVLISACCMSITLCIALMASWMQPVQDECRVTVLDVGQGQCILLQSQGKSYLVDCGGDSDTEAANIAANMLLSQGISKLDGIILTHYDRDHAGGVSYLLSRVSVDMLFLPNCVDSEGILETIKTEHDGDRLIINQLTRIDLEETHITLIPSKNNLSDNEAGLCILFQTENCDILITGDRSAAGERELLRQMDIPELEVLIVGHHGSANSTCQTLLEQTSPEIAIISVGADNSYGHPTQETLQRLQAAGCVIYRTDQNGTVTYRG